jgi:peptidoglycan/LPS O-acetylase OafA/YrhL
MERAGNLDWLRLVAAGMVFFSHQLAVFNLPNPEFFDGPAPGAIGVYIFFAISGYVNTKSILRKRSVISFLVARILRIYPAVIGCSLFCVALGSVITLAAPADFWRGSTSFLLHNSTLVNLTRNSLPGVFSAMPVGGVVNASVWTLSYEVWAYLSLAAMMALTAYARHAVTAMFTGLLLLPLAVTFSAWDFLFVLALIFYGGAAMAVIETQFGGRGALLAYAAGLLFASIALPYFVAVRVGMIGVPLLAAIAPQLRGPRLDISYGLFLYHFPIQQTIAYMGAAFLIAAPLSALLAVAAAIASAVLIERPALGMRARMLAVSH